MSQATPTPDLLAWVPLDARRVLQPGCGDGSFAAAYRLRNPGVHYTGVEMAGAVAEEAAAHVDRLLVGDFAAMDDAELMAGEPFDAIVLGDVLERVADPDAALARLRGLLAPGGTLVVSVFNVAHWAALFHLMHGAWPAQDGGLFDSGTLRRFTRASLAQHLADAGFVELKVRPRNHLLDKEKAERWLPALADTAEAMGIDRAAFLQRSQALQWVVAARRADDPAPPSLTLSIAALAPALLDVRARLPAEQIGAAPGVVVHYRERAITLPPVPPGRAKILVVQRPRVPDSAAWAQITGEAMRQGWLVVVEQDDHPDLIAAVHGRTPDAADWLPVRGAHAVQTSTPVLAAAFAPHQPEVAVFPNCAFALPPFRARAGEPVRVFFGALNRERFSRQVAAALAPTLAAHPEVRFTVVHDRAFFEALPTAAKEFRPTLPYAGYLDAMAGCHIALMPLEGTPAERAKSDVKWVEAASLGLAAIASPAVYADTIRDGETGLIAAAPADFAAALARLLDDPAARARMAQAAWTEVRDRRMFATQAGARIDWYLSLWDRRHALEAARAARMGT